MTRDQFGNYARWDGVPNQPDGSIKHVLAGGSGPPTIPPSKKVPIYGPPQPSAIL